MSSNDRQKRYRKRRSEAGGVRLDVWVGCECNDALKKVSDVLAISKSQLIERLIVQAGSVLDAVG